MGIFDFLKGNSANSGKFIGGLGEHYCSQECYDRGGAEVRNVRGLERTYFMANLERKASLVVLNLVDATGRLYTVEQDIRILSFTTRENQITGSRIPEFQNQKFVFQDQDMSQFTKVLQSIEKANPAS